MTTAEQILEALGEVGMDLVDLSEKQRFSRSFLRRTLPLAACAALMITCGVLAQRYLTAAPETPTALATGTVDMAAEKTVENTAANTGVVPAEQVLLSSQSSLCTDSSARRNNLTLACEAIDGMVLQPGEEFSFNAAVGERTETKGYLAAGTYADDAATSEVGGGIGQVASMLYCASLKLDLEQLERAGNTYAVSYVPLGFDAAVYWNVTDYRFRNSLSTAIEIRAEVVGEEIIVALWGQPKEEKNIELKSIPHSDNTVEAVQVFLDEEGNVMEERSIGITRYEVWE